MQILICLALLLFSSAPAAAFDCRATLSSVQQLVCAHGPLSVEDDAVDSQFQQGLLQLSQKGQDGLKEGRDKWYALRDTVCSRGAVGMKAAEQVSCLEKEYAARKGTLRNVVTTTKTGLSIFRAEHMAARVLLRPEGITMHRQHIAWPQIDDPQTPQHVAWNAHMTKLAARTLPDPAFCGGDPVNISRDYAIRFTSVNVISVAVTVESSCPASVKKERRHFVDNRVLSGGRALSAADLFDVTTDWKHSLSALVLEEAGLAAVEVDDTLNTAITKPSRWALAENGLTVVFDGMDEKPAAAPREATVPWQKLHRYLSAYPVVRVVRGAE